MTDTRSDIAGAIIAGGRARRMGGRVKALIQVAGQTILERQLSVLGERVTAIAISANEAGPYAHTGLPILPDRVPGQGPLAGLEAALAWSPAPYLLALASDMPHVRGAVLDLLIAHLGDHLVARRAPDVDIVVPYVAGQAQPLCALYARTVQAAIQARLHAGHRRATGLIEDPAMRVVRISEDEIRAVDPALETFVNLNTPADL